MNAILRGCCVLILVLTSTGFAAEPSAKLDLRRAVPAEAHMLVHGRHNPKREYQREYAAKIWQTVQDEKLIDRMIELVTSHVPDDQLDGARSVFKDVNSAVEKVDWKSIGDAEEIVFAQVLEMPANQNLLIARLTPADAESCETAVKNLFAVIEQRAGEHVKVNVQSEGGVETTTLEFPNGVPFQPTVARSGSVLILSSSATLARRSVTMLLGSGESSKFDDPRLADALAQLPEPEDALIFFDGRQMLVQMRKMGDFIRQQSHGEPKAARAAAIFEQIIDEFTALDYEATSQSTDGFRICATAVGKLTPDAHAKLLGQMLGSGEPFTDWQRRIPANATAYSLSTGVNLHPAYEHVIEFLHTNVPEASPGLEKFQALQDQIGVQLDRDILQSFSGECISLTLPKEKSAAATGSDSVAALRCHNPDRIRELLHQGVEALQKLPAVQMQQLKLQSCQDLEGFEEVSASPLAAFGARPVVGFHDGWMIIASNPDAARTVIDTWSGSGATIADSEAFQRFGLKIEGPVYMLSYCDLAAQTRRAAQMIRQAGLAAPMILGLVGAKANPDAVKALQEGLQLLPSVAKVVDQFDFLQAKLTVVQAGTAADTYLKRTVTLVRPPTESATDTHATDDHAVAPTVK